MSAGIHSSWFSAVRRDTDLCIITLSTYMVLHILATASASALYTTSKSLVSARRFLTGTIWISVGVAATEQSLCLYKQLIITHVSSSDELPYRSRTVADSGYRSHLWQLKHI